MKVIINADEFGFSKGVNLGIAEAFENGIVTSTTIMANMPAFDHAVKIYKQNPAMNVGIHLTLTAGYPVLDNHTTVVDQNGKFKNQGAFFSSVSRLDLEEILLEFDAQIKKALQAGIRLTHIDSHNHIHELEVFEYVLLELTSKYNLPIRGINDRHINRFKKRGIKTCDDFSAEFYGQFATEAKMIEIVNRTREKSIEIMCHPAYIDYELYHGAGDALKRMDELKVLTGQKLKTFFSASKFQLCGYGELYAD